MIAPPAVRPVVIGAGPAGLFAASGARPAAARGPFLLERGECVERRRRDVERFWAATGELNVRSNVQFGEGGAGTFSDGKLNTGTKDVRHRATFVERLRRVRRAARTSVISAKPHIGTDVLIRAGTQSAAGSLLAHGAQVALRRIRLAGLQRGTHGTPRCGITSPDGQGRKTLARAARWCSPSGTAPATPSPMLRGAGVPLEPKPFAVGVRIEHRQSDMDAQQYKQYAGHPSLPPTSYKPQPTSAAAPACSRSASAPADRSSPRQARRARGQRTA